MNYVLACITLFHGGAKEVNIKARGRAISRAVDVVEIVRRRFLPDVKVGNINIGTETIQVDEGPNVSRNVSTIEITLTL
jgi:DNA-binding protein